MDEYQNIPSLLRSWSKELEANCNRVRSLIGDAHWFLDGKHKELILAEFIEKNLPNGTTQRNGFVLDSLISGKVSGEIDILILSEERRMPIFDNGQFCICLLNDLLGWIHVKTTFSKQEALDLMESNLKLSRLGLDLSKDTYFSAAFFYRVKENVESISDYSAIQTYLDSPNLMPRHICILGTGNIIASTEGLKAIDSGDYAVAVFLADLLSHCGNDVFPDCLTSLLGNIGLEINSLPWKKKQ